MVFPRFNITPYALRWPGALFGFSNDLWQMRDSDL